MTVYELFHTIDKNQKLKNDFIDTYIVNECQSDDFPRDCDKQVESIYHIREYLKAAFEAILAVKPIHKEDAIVIVLPGYDDVLDPFDSKVYYSSSLVHLDDLLAHKDKIDLSEYDGPGWVESYAYEFSDWEEILGWEVSSACLDKFGILNCAHAIFTELTFNGIYDESRNERKADLEESLADFEASKDDPDFEKKLVSGDDFLAELRAHMYDSIEDEDEKTYRQIEDKYDEMCNNETREIWKKQYQKRAEEYRLLKEEILKMELALHA